MTYINKNNENKFKKKLYKIMPSEPKLIVYFKSIAKDYLLKNYKFLEYEGSIKEEGPIEIDIPDKYFEPNKCATKAYFELFSDDKMIKRKFCFNLFYGRNYATCFMKKDGKLAEINFKNMKEPPSLTVCDNIQIKDCDTNNTSYKKRFVLINIDDLVININNKKIDFNNFLPIIPQNNENNNKDKENNSIKFSIYDYTNNKILSNYINDVPDILDYCDNYNKYNNNLKNFKKDFENLFMTNNEEIDLGTIDGYFNDIPQTNLNIAKYKLEKMLSNIKYIDYEINATLIKLVKHFYKSSKIIKKSKLENLYNYFIKITKKINEDERPNYYQKIILLNQYFLTSLKFENIDDFILSKFDYYFFSEAKKNSVLYFVKNFFMQFIDGLKEEHKAFDKLSELDGEIGYYKNMDYFCFSMDNLYEIQTHLKEKFPEIITIYHNSLKKNSSIYCNKIGYITLNMERLKNFEELNMIKVLNKYNVQNDKNFSAKIIYYLIRNIRNDNSPSFYINDENKKIYYYCENREINQFFKLLFHKYKNINLPSLLIKLNNYGKICDRVDLFLDNLDLFIDYLITLNKGIKHNINFNLIKDYSIEKEIQYIKNNISTQKCSSNKINKEKNIIDEKPNDIKEKILTRIVYDTFKFHDLKDKFDYTYRKRKVWTQRENEIRQYLIRTHNIDGEIKRIFFAADLTEEQKSEYFHIYNEMIYDNICG